MTDEFEVSPNVLGQVKAGRRVGKPKPVPDPILDLEKRRVRARRLANRENARKGKETGPVPISRARTWHAAYRREAGLVRIGVNLTNAEVDALTAISSALALPPPTGRGEDRARSKAISGVKAVMNAIGDGLVLASPGARQNDPARTAEVPDRGRRIYITIRELVSTALLDLAEHLNCAEQTRQNTARRHTIGELLRWIAAGRITLTRKEQDDADLWLNDPARDNGAVAGPGRDPQGQPETIDGEQAGG